MRTHKMFDTSPHRPAGIPAHKEVHKGPAHMWSGRRFHTRSDNSLHTSAALPVRKEEHRPARMKWFHKGAHRPVHKEADRPVRRLAGSESRIAADKRFRKLSDKAFRILRRRNQPVTDTASRTEIHTRPVRIEKSNSVRRLAGIGLRMQVDRRSHTGDSSGSCPRRSIGRSARKEWARRAFGTGHRTVAGKPARTQVGRRAGTEVRKVRGTSPRRVEGRGFRTAAHMEQSCKTHTVLARGRKLRMTSAPLARRLRCMADTGTPQRSPRWPLPQRRLHKPVLVGTPREAGIRALARSRWSVVPRSKAQFESLGSRQPRLRAPRRRSLESAPGCNRGQRSLRTGPHRQVAGCRCMVSGLRPPVAGCCDQC